MCFAAGSQTARTMPRIGALRGQSRVLMPGPFAKASMNSIVRLADQLIR
jgi:hypothetical protein